MKRMALAALLAFPALAQAPNVAPWEEGAVGAPWTWADAQAAGSGAGSAAGSGALIARGRALFVARFTDAEGAGRPMATQADIPTPRRRPAAQAHQRLSGPDATSCADCHHQPVIGGAGGFAANAFTAEGARNAEFDILDPQFSSERGTTHLFGAGLIELLAREMTRDLRGLRAQAAAEARATGAPVTVALETKGVRFGALTALPDGTLDTGKVEGIDPDLTLRPFGQKGVVGTLRRFTVTALNAHHGMQAAERFGARWTGSADFDADGVADELDAGDISALVAFQASLPPPVPSAPDDPQWAALAADGAQAFDALGCAACHIPALPLDSLTFTDPSPFEGAGTLREADVAAPIALDLATQDWAARLPRDAEGRALVPLYGDLKRHAMVDAQVAGFGGELLSQGFVERDVFLTAELWGAGDTAPYGHRGDMTTLDAAIRAHGGAGRAARDAYVDAEAPTRAAVIAFLKALRAPQ